MDRARKVAAPVFETLEARLLLSGAVEVSVVGGSLLIVGDSQDNAITIEQTGQGSYTITGRSDTAIRKGMQGGTSQSVTGAIKDININMGKGGNDSVEMASDLIVGDVKLATRQGARGNVNYVGGPGDDELVLAGAAARGSITFTGNPAAGDTIQITDALGHTDIFEFVQDSLGTPSTTTPLGLKKTQAASR